MIAGKGFYLWNVPACELGNYAQIAEVARAAGLSHVLVKIADGVGAFNKTGQDLVLPLAAALRAAGISVWGWHYVYGLRPVDEAAIAASRMKRLGLDGYVIDAETEFKQPGKAKAAKTLLAALRATLPDSIPVGLSSYRFPELHREFPWKEFISGVDLVLPQVYWEQAHNPAQQLSRSVQEYRALTSLPIIPTGAAYKSGGWAAAPGEATAFLQQARDLGLAGASFWSWDNCRKHLPATWSAIAAFSWRAPEPPYLPELPWPATVVQPRAKLFEGPGSGPALGDLYQGARPLVQEIKFRDGAQWGRVGDNLWSPIADRGVQYLEWVR